MIKATPFDFPYDGRLVAENTALVVIDLQQDFLSTTGYFARKGYDPSPLRAILPTVNWLIAASRNAGVRVIHTRQGYRADMRRLGAGLQVAQCIEFEFAWRRCFVKRLGELYDPATGLLHLLAGDAGMQ